MTMRSFTRARKALAVAGLTLVVLGGSYFLAVSPHHSFAPPQSTQGLLERADRLSWNGRWAEAQPLYEQAAHLFAGQGRYSQLLYAKVSEVPVDESVSAPAKILELTQMLQRPEAQDPATRLRILTIRGGLEINYDANEALATWKEVQSLALRQGQIKLATRASGNEGIAYFILGDTETAKEHVVNAWKLALVERDPEAAVRYGSAFGTGLVQFGRFKEALGPLDKAISMTQSDPELAYPTIAVYAKIDALAGLHLYPEALALAHEALVQLQGTSWDGHKATVYISLGSIEREQGNLAAAVEDYRQSVSISQRIDNYRGIVQAGGLLALSYEGQNKLPEAENAINAAIEANTKIPDELVFAPGNLAVKADILEKMGQPQQAEALYRKSIVLVNGMLQHAPTANVQRELISEMSDVYSGYFAALCQQKRYNEALQVLDNVRGRIEADALEHHSYEPVHPPTPAERELTRLNVSLINTDDPAQRTVIANAIYTTELGMAPSLIAKESITHPVKLPELQRSLGPNALLLEYVLAKPASYVFAITHDSVKQYQLPPKEQIDDDAKQYRRSIRLQKPDDQLAHRLFSELLQPVQEYSRKTDLVIVPDGSLHLLPFSALKDNSGYVLSSHTIDVDPSATVYALIHQRTEKEKTDALPYIGVAAWTQAKDTRNPVFRAVSGPAKSEFIPLPDSQMEVESIAKDLPRPSTVLEGAEATETRFKQLPLDSTEVIHLALHGYADLDYPDRSALVFAPDSSGTDDGLLQVREIRNLHLKSKLVTLSACDTGVGPVGESGVANLVNAFIEAGADSVVSTLWELADQPTAELMQSFYAQLATHNRKVDALRTAQLELLNKGLSPYYWASFQIVGDADGNL